MMFLFTKWGEFWQESVVKGVNFGKSKQNFTSFLVKGQKCREMPLRAQVAISIHSEDKRERLLKKL